MIKQIIAIGGGGFGRNPGEGIIENFILNQSSKEIPNICLFYIRRLKRRKGFSY